MSTLNSSLRIDFGLGLGSCTFAQSPRATNLFFKLLYTSNSYILDSVSMTVYESLCCVQFSRSERRIVSARFRPSKLSVARRNLNHYLCSALCTFGQDKLLLGIATRCVCTCRRYTLIIYIQITCCSCLGRILSGFEISGIIDVEVIHVHIKMS